MKNQKQLQKEFLSAFADFVIDTFESEEDEDDTETQYNNMLSSLAINKELKTLVHRLVQHKDQEDAWGEFLLQVAEIKDKQKVLDVWNKQNREYHWYMVRVICNQFKSNTSHYYRQYRRQNHNVDDNSHNIIEYANDIGVNHQVFDGYVLDTVNSSLLHEDNTEANLDNQLIMNEVNWFINNKLSWYEKEIYSLYYCEELSHVKISKTTNGIPPTSIGHTVRGVLAKIQKHLTSVGIIKDNDINI